MSQQNEHISNSAPADFPVKRRRGRPRKDENLVKKPNLNSPMTPVSVDMKRTQPINQNDIIVNDGMVGRVVSGVIEGTFDAGYLLSVRAGNSETLLRGVVFQPGLFTPITSTNDVAPHAKMYQRREVPIPICSQVNGSVQQSEQNTKQPIQVHEIHPPPQVKTTVMLPGDPPATESQSTTVMVSPIDMPKNISDFPVGGEIMLQQDPEFSFQSQSALPLPNLKMVEQDEVMQVFEVSKLTGHKTDVDEATIYVASEPTCQKVIDVFPGSEPAINQVPEVEPQTVESGELKQESVSNEKGQDLEPRQTPVVAMSQCAILEPQILEKGKPLKSLNLEPHQSPIVTESLPMPPKVDHGAMGVFMEKPNFETNDVPLNTELKLPVKEFRNDDTMNDETSKDLTTTLNHAAGDNIESVLRPDPRGVEAATPFIPELENQESTLPGRHSPPSTDMGVCSTLEDVCICESTHN